MQKSRTAFAAVALTLAVAACSSPESAPEPQNESTAEAMPQTPDLSDTAADEKAAGVPTPTPETPPVGGAPDPSGSTAPAT